MGRPSRGLVLIADAWSLVLAGVLTAPVVFGSGYPLARDLLFVPRLPWSEQAWGLGGASPRSVPLDGVLAALTVVVDGRYVATVVLPVILALAGMGAHRVMAGFSAPARLGAASFAIWNPFVIERLALGQWALLLGFAAMPWIGRAAVEWRRARQTEAVARVLLWTGLASLTPTGGLLAVATALVCGACGGRRIWMLPAGVGILQLPWIVPALIGPASVTSDPDGVAAFAVRAEGSTGVLVTLLGLGGIWDARSVPDSRESAITIVAAIVTVAALVLGAPMLRRTWGTLWIRFLAVGCVALLASGFTSTGVGETVLRWMVGSIPGLGLFRDGQKFIAPFVYLTVFAFSAAIHRLWNFGRGRATEIAVSGCLLLIALPIAMVPDAPRATWPTLRPVEYPDSFEKVEDRMAEVGGDGSLITLPWRSYRYFEWGSGSTSADPAARWYDMDVIVSDDLQVGEMVIEGESSRARAVKQTLESGVSLTRLRTQGVRWVLVYDDDPAASDLDVSGLALAYDDAHVTLFMVPGGTSGPGGPTRLDVAAVVAADVIALMTLLAGVAVLSRGRWNRRSQIR